MNLLDAAQQALHALLLCFPDGCVEIANLREAIADAEQPSPSGALTEEYVRRVAKEEWLACRSIDNESFCSEFALRLVARFQREQEAVAWLITGSRIYQDTVVISSEWADIRIEERGNKDTSRKAPLFAFPPAQPSAKVDKSVLKRLVTQVFGDDYAIAHKEHIFLNPELIRMAQAEYDKDLAAPQPKEGAK